MTRGVRVRNFTLTYGERTVLRDLDLDIAPGEFVALLGRSGSGKTSLLRVLGGLERSGFGIVDAPSTRAVVFQEHRLLPWKRVWENVALGLGPHSRERALATLADVELRERAEAWPLTLSGGEAQRAGLARALVREPDLLLLDEPFASLDALTRLHVQALVARLWRERRPAVLLVTHDVDEAIALADRALVLVDCKIAHEFRIEHARPRDVADPHLREVRRCLLASLGVSSALEPPVEHVTATVPALAP